MGTSLWAKAALVRKGRERVASVSLPATWRQISSEEGREREKGEERNEGELAVRRESRRETKARTGGRTGDESPSDESVRACLGWKEVLLGKTRG